MKLHVVSLPWYRNWKGLLGTRKPQAVHLKTRFGIHTFGMKYPIDVVILDSKFRIQKLQSNLVPNRIFFWNPFYEHVIEMEQGIIKKNDLSLGQKMTITY